MYKYNFEGFCILRIFTDSLFRCWIAWKLWTFSRDFLKSKVISAFSVVLSFSAPLFWVHCCFVCICNPRSVCSCNSLCICICNPLCVSIRNSRCNCQARKTRHRWCGCLQPAGKMHPTLQAAPCQPTTFTQASRRWLTGRRSGAGSVLWRRRRRRRRRREYQQRCMKPVACPRRFGCQLQLENHHHWPHVASSATTQWNALHRPVCLLVLLKIQMQIQIQ